MKQTYVYDNASGNLLSRDYRLSGSPKGLTEYFQYDNLNRLTGSQVSGAGLMSVTYSPDGNIITKSDAGSYTYDPSKPNAVSSISGNNGTISQEDQLITYNGYNLTTRIEEGNSAYSVYYNPLKQRIKTVCTSVGAPAITRYYSGSYEKTITGSTVTETHYVTSPAGLIAILVKQGSNVQIYYVETDHLGSVIGIINTDKSYKFDVSYDAWGRRRNPTDWSYNNIPATLITDRGFTGHEHLDGFGLINMNGRMYDPVAGRFLGVDPVIQAPDYSQSFNAYSYCLNNPLKYIDPSGYERRQYESESINPAYFAEFIQALMLHGLDYAVGSVPHESKICYYDDTDGSFEFSIDWFGSIEGAQTIITEDGYMLSDVNVFSKKVKVYLQPNQFNNLLIPSGDGGVFNNFLENTSSARDVVTVITGGLRLATDDRIPAGTPKYKPSGFNPALEAQVAKGLKVTNSILRNAGRALGVFSIVEHGNQAYQAFDSGNIWRGIGYTALAGLDLGLMFLRSSPTVLVVSVIYGVLDATAF